MSEQENSTEEKSKPKESAKEKSTIWIQAIVTLGVIIVAVVGAWQAIRIAEIQNNNQSSSSSMATTVSTVSSDELDQTVTIEAIPLSVFAYDGEGDPNVEVGEGRLSFILNGDSTTGYRFQYYLPPEADGGYAGFVFRFSEPYDLSNFESIEFQVQFENNAQADFAISDELDKKTYLHLGDFKSYDDSINVVVSGNTQRIIIPLNIFDSVNLKIVKEFGFNVGRHFAQGSNEFTVSNVKLLK